MDAPENQNFSIIVPTFHEAKNIPELIKRIAEVNFGPRAFEVILVDDKSNDGIEEVVQSLQIQFPWLRLIVRKGERGLSESILDGFKAAKYPILITLDADLSHPPEKIPEMLLTLEQPGVDVVIGSRYIKGGSSDELWPIVRKGLSRLGALIARILIGVPVKDPLSGFMAIRGKMLKPDIKLQPIGWKIGLEIMVKCRCKQIREIPIHFAQRTVGVSKLNFNVMIKYLHHLTQLICFKLFSISSK